MSAALQQLPSLLPAPVGDTPPSLEARRPTPRYRDSPKYRLFFLPSRSSSGVLLNNNRGLTAALRSGVASVAAEETALPQSQTATSVQHKTEAATATAAPVRRIAVRRSTMDHGDAKHPVKPAVIPTNIVQWLQHACPAEILPKVLSFCGPQKSWTLMKTNRFWYHLITNDATWRVVCEDTYKVRIIISLVWKGF